MTEQTINGLDWLCDEPQPPAIPVHTRRWNILIVDDDPHVHEATELALKGFVFEDSGLNILHAYSKAECLDMLARAEDIALLFLDVVMESEYAGLEVVCYLREELANSTTRIILRTGQPGVAPEQQVIRDYDIDGYNNKTQMRQQDLEIALLTSLRSYRDVCRIQAHKATLERIVTAISSISRLEDLASFSDAILEQIRLTLSIDNVSIFLASRDKALGNDGAVQTRLLTIDQQGISFYEDGIDTLNADFQRIYTKTLASKDSFSNETYIAKYLRSKRGNDCVFCIHGEFYYNNEEVRLIKLFLVNVILAYEKILLARSLQHTQSLILSLLGSVTESRSNETAAHVIRVGLYSEKLALLSGCSDVYAGLLGQAAQLHDVGKVATPDHILNKPGALDQQEWQIMKLHAEEGWRILQGSDNPVLDLGAQVALDHHEHWNGQGYPGQKMGEAISLAGRIVAIADVFDALCSKRCYKPAWDMQKAKAEIIRGAGSHFDARLVKVFDTNFAQFAEIWRANPDGGKA